MRAVVLRADRLSVRETPDPEPGAGEMLVSVVSTAICASDVHYMDHPEAGVNDPTGRSCYDPDRDVVLGHEFVGEVIAHGPGCSQRFPVGTRVTSIPIRLVDGGTGGTRIIGQHPDSPGSFAEKLVIAEVIAREVPRETDPDAAALTDAFAVGEFYVRNARPTDGEIPIVIGAGAIGLSAVAALARRRIEPIIVSDFDAGRRALARDAFGAHILVDPAQESPFAVWRTTRAERDMWGSAVVIECAGAPGLIQRLTAEADMGTRIACAGGWYSGDTLDITAATRKGVNIQFGGGPMPEDWYGTLEAITTGNLDPLPSVGAVIGLDEVPAALDRVRRSQGPARVIVHPNGDPR
ncbi:alcohol dehydrogenase catalytic domain-containing protein [Nocardia rhamnosiphila]|uniref:alcohol dehydrogenase catalytic domain-containing protein n=1 Tax=Nocardia rhamnosiphila TaxID=426716 RepID=UPI003400715B